MSEIRPKSSSCAPEEYSLVGRVRNIGEASTPAGVPVYFFEGVDNNRASGTGKCPLPPG